MKLPCTLYKIPLKVIIKNVLGVQISKAKNAGTCNKSKVKLQCMSSTPDLNFQLSEMLICTHFEHPKLIYLACIITDWLIGLRCFCDYCERCEISCLMIVDSCSFVLCLIVFMLLNWHCVISWLCSHIDRCYSWLHLSWFGIMGCFSREVVTIVTTEVKDDFNCDRFSTNMFLSLGVKVLDAYIVGRHVSSLMCQHGMESKGRWRHFSFSFAHIL